MSAVRLNYDNSIRRLRESGFLGPNESPAIPGHLPQPGDDGPLGLEFYKTFVGDEAIATDLSDLTIPRTFFGRSEINNVSFRNTDLTESNLCWNDFIVVDFTLAILARADLRASAFTRVTFVRSDLRGADLRRSTFEECQFLGALMDGAHLTHDQLPEMSLSTGQQDVIQWHDDDGPQPSGG
jgi:BTB/POZ domain-containing protein KCTD9